MKRRLLDLLRCPDCAEPLDVRVTSERGCDIESGTLSCPRCAAEWPITDSIPRFVPADNYASSFGWQWQKFATTQLDSRSGLPISRERFYRYCGWKPEELNASLTLDAGCGSGRFAEIALDAGAELVAIDYSTAVDACRKNLGHSPALHLVQCDIRALPFAPGTFDYIYSLGVLQHTPDPREAFHCLTRKVRPGGRIAVDLYFKQIRTAFWPKYWLRPFLRRMNKERLYRLIERAVPVLLPISRFISRLPFGMKLRQLVPVANYERVYPLSPAQVREWAVLDTFDMLSPEHDHPQTARAVRRWFTEAGFRQFEVFRDGFLVGRGRKEQGG
jgi:SAM-dependent methyltransferase